LEKRSRFPFWTAAAVGATVVVFAGQQLSGAPMSNATMERWGAPNGFDIWDGSLWALFTSPFVHLGWGHAGFNLLWLWYLGRPVERLLGSVRYPLLFIAAAWVSSASELAVSDNTGVGLSGIVYALFGFSWVARNRFPELRKRVGSKLTVWFMISFAGGILADRLGIMPIANTAHASGLLFGLVAGATALRQKWARTWAAAALTCLVAVASLPLVWAAWSPSWNGVQGDRAYDDGDLDAALAHFTRAVELEPEYPWAYEQIGWCHWDRNAYELAVDAFHAALAQDPESAEALAGRGSARSMLGQQAQALIDLERAIERSPAYAFAHQHRAWCHSELGDHAKALEAFTAAARLDPDEVWNQAGLGRTYRMLGRLAQADEALTRALELDSNLSYVLDERGRLRLDQGRPRDAIKEFSAALTLDPEYHWSLQGRGHARRNVGEIDGAIQDLQRAIEFDATNVQTHHDLAHALYRKGDWKGALGAAERCIALTDGEFAGDWLLAAMSQWQLGQKKRAKESYVKSKNGTEDDPEVAALRAEAIKLLTSQ
jgi:tetratricopeptide (TPR) repeat protein/membrane associated rhomboid family serine protease